MKFLLTILHNSRDIYYQILFQVILILQQDRQIGSCVRLYGNYKLIIPRQINIQQLSNTTSKHPLIILHNMKQTGVIYILDSMFCLLDKTTSTLSVLEKLADHYIPYKKQ